MRTKETAGQAKRAGQPLGDEGAISWKVSWFLSQRKADSEETTVGKGEEEREGEEG